MRLFDSSSAYNGSVLKHILKVYKVTVMHMLRKIVGIMEMDKSVFMSFYYIRGKKNTSCNILTYFTRHIVTLYGVYLRVLIGVFLLYFLVVTLNKTEYLVVCSVCSTDKATCVTVADITLCRFIRAILHNKCFYKFLYFFDRQSSVKAGACLLNFPCNTFNLYIGKLFYSLFGVHN